MPAANTNTDAGAQELTPRERKKIVGPVLGSAFDPSDRLFPSYARGGVFEYGATESRDLKCMLEKDGKARALEQALCMPIRGADYEITGERADEVKEAIPNLDLVIDQMTSASTYRKAFFEKVWKMDGGRVSYDKLIFRPATSCDAWYDVQTGDLKGFRQRTRLDLNFNYADNGKPLRNMALPRYQNRRLNMVKDEPGWVYIPIQRAFVYVHGLHRDPIRGVSDMDVAYWAYETRRKVMFLWFQFLENTSLPKTIVYGEDQTEANENASYFAQLKTSGALGLKRDPEGRSGFDTIDSAGQGAAQFQAAVQYLETMMAQSVLAGFMDLTSAASSGAGSYALSADQSEFFLVSRQAVADEMAQSINRNLIAPYINYNYGDVALPEIKIGPISNRETERAFTLLQSIVAAPQLNVPQEFVGELVKYTASYLGLNPSEIEKQVDAYTVVKKQQDEEARQMGLKSQQAAIDAPQIAAQQAQAAGGATGRPAAARKPAQKPSGGRKAGGSGKSGVPARPKNLSMLSDEMVMAEAVNAAYDLISLAEQGYDPKDLLLAGK